MKALFSILVMAAILLYVQAWFYVVEQDYSFALANGVIAFVMAVIASHLDMDEDLC